MAVPVAGEEPDVVTARRQPGPGRPRDPSLEANVLAAALVEYGHTGLAGFTMDGVARRAKVGKSSLYLRWPSKERLLVDAIEAQTLPLAVPDTGSVAGDMLALAVRLFEHFLDPLGWITLRIAVDIALNTRELDRFHERVTVMHGETARAMLQRAVDRGELAPDAPFGPIIETLFGSVLIHVLAMAPADREPARAHATDHVGPLVDFVLERARVSGA
jgi:AcrR family transcriptional regulator